MLWVINEIDFLKFAVVDVNYTGKKCKQFWNGDFFWLRL